MNTPLRWTFITAGLALGLYGLVRFVFNGFGIRIFGAAFIGEVNTGISSATVVAALVAAGPSVLASKYIAEYVGRREDGRADALFSGALVLNSVLSLVASLVLLSYVTTRWEYAAYALLFSSYIFLKGSYFAYGRNTEYFRAELVATISFFVVFLAAVFSERRALAAASLLAHPCVFCAIALFDHRACLRWANALGELGRETRAYSAFVAASLANALSGVGSYHLVVVLAAGLLGAPDEVGYLSALLSALSPLNLLPSALGAALFPALSRRYGEGDVEGQVSLVARATLFLQTSMTPAIAAMCLFPYFVFASLGIPMRADLLVLWSLVCLDAGLSIISAPCGNFLNATAYVRQQATLSVITLVGGIALGLPALVRFGVVGAGVMRFLAVAPLAWARMGLTEMRLGWVAGIRAPFVAGHAAFLFVAIAAFTRPSPTWASLLVVVAVVGQVPGAVFIWRSR